MNVEEFAESVMSYYGAFENAAVAKLFVNYAGKVNPAELERIFDWLVVNVPANWHIDVKAFTDACKAMQVPMLKPKKTCVCCGALFTGYYCDNCLYDPNGGDTVEEYRRFYVDRKANPEKYAAMADKLKKTIAKLNAAKTVRGFPAENAT
ncbi:MAG: hypothetical protein MJ196_06010 [Treponemataceae bacterium]|nr:hypothetical protein [Treponemataceae bacterium]